MDLNLLPIFSQEYDVGRASILVAVTGSPGSEVPTYWDGVSPIQFMHLSNTEGEIVPAANSEYSDLTLQESTGPALIKRYLTGHKPSFQTNVFADKRVLRFLSPVASASGGSERQSRVREQTWWLVPEQLFLKDVNGKPTLVEVSLTAGTWTKDGDPFSVEDQRLFDLSMFLWKGHTEQAMVPYRHENAGKSNMQLTWNSLQDFSKPDGHQLWTMGADLSESGINLEGDDS